MRLNIGPRYRESHIRANLARIIYIETSAYPDNRRHKLEPSELRQADMTHSERNARLERPSGDCSLEVIYPGAFFQLSLLNAVNPRSMISDDSLFGETFLHGCAISSISAIASSSTMISKAIITSALGCPV